MYMYRYIRDPNTGALNVPEKIHRFILRAPLSAVNCACPLGFRKGLLNTSEIKSTKASISQCVGQPCQPVRDEGGVDFSKKPSENKFLLTLAAPVSLPPAVSGLDQRREKISSANSHLPISVPQSHKLLLTTKDYCRSTFSAEKWFH